MKAAIFDFDGTLVDFVETDIACLKHLHSMADTVVTQELFVETAIDRIMKFHELVDSGNIDPKTMDHHRLFNTFRELGIKWNEFYVDVYRAELFERTKPFPGVVDLLARLKGKVKLGLLTNAYDPDVQNRRIVQTGLREYFDEILISGEEVFSKPDPRVFHLISRRLGVRPVDCVFIGDSRKFDICGAESAGMQAVLVHPAADMEELCTLLEGLIP